jgi:hypothetical protein
MAAEYRRAVACALLRFRNIHHVNVWGTGLLHKVFYADEPRAGLFTLRVEADRIGISIILAQAREAHPSHDSVICKPPPHIQAAPARFEASVRRIRQA